MRITFKTYLNIYEWIIVVIAIIMITPLLASRIPTVVNAALFGFWIVLVLLHTGWKISFSYEQRLMVVSISIFIFIVVFYKLIGYTSAEIGNCFHQIMFMAGMLEIIYIDNYSPVICKKKIFWIIWIVSFINIIDNIRLGIIYPNASVYATNLTWYTYLKNTNVGSTVFNTYVLVYYAICLMLYTSVRDKKKKALFAISSLLSAIYLLFFGLRASIVILMFIVTIVLFIVRNNKQNSKKAIISIIVLFIVGVLLIAFYDKITISLLHFLPDNRLTARLETLSQLSISGIDETAFSGRLGLILESLRTFSSSIKNVLIGIGDHRSVGGYSGFLATGIGGHSELIDTLARFGLLGFLMLILSLSSYRRYLKRLYDNTRSSQQVTTIFVLVVICMSIRAFFYQSIGVVTFILLPLAREIIEEEEKN